MSCPRRGSMGGEGSQERVGGGATGPGLLLPLYRKLRFPRDTGSRRARVTRTCGHPGLPRPAVPESLQGRSVSWRPVAPRLWGRGGRRGCRGRPAAWTGRRVHSSRLTPLRPVGPGVPPAREATGGPGAAGPGGPGGPARPGAQDMHRCAGESTLPPTCCPRTRPVPSPEQHTPAFPFNRSLGHLLPRHPAPRRGRPGSLS